MILNIRGANGSGKTTLAKKFIYPDSREVALCTNLKPKRQPAYITGMLSAEKGMCLVGSYKTACGGMDAIPNFGTAFAAIRGAEQVACNVICEGVLASTVYGSWAEFASSVTDFAFVYMTTPLEECLRRIQIRNGGKPIKEKLVKDKIKAVAGTRAKALAAGHLVYDLPYEFPEVALAGILAGRGEPYRVHRR